MKKINNVNKFREFKREVNKILDKYFDEDFIIRVFKMIDEQINKDGLRIVSLDIIKEEIKDGNIVINYNVTTRSEKFQNIIKVPLYKITKEELENDKIVKDIKKYLR